MDNKKHELLEHAELLNQKIKDLSRGLENFNGTPQDLEKIKVELTTATKDIEETLKNVSMTPEQRKASKIAIKRYDIIKLVWYMEINIYALIKLKKPISQFNIPYRLHKEKVDKEIINQTRMYVDEINAQIKILKKIGITLQDITKESTELEIQGLLHNVQKINNKMYDVDATNYIEQIIGELEKNTEVEK